jgi:vancomycin resistance protein YoaR
MFENNNRKKYGKIKKSDDRFGVAAGSGEPGSSLYGMRNFKSKTPNNVNPRASSTLNSIYGIKYDEDDLKENNLKQNELKQKEAKQAQQEKNTVKPARTVDEVLKKALVDDFDDYTDKTQQNQDSAKQKSIKHTFDGSKYQDKYNSGSRPFGKTDIDNSNVNKSKTAEKSSKSIFGNGLFNGGSKNNTSGSSQKSRQAVQSKSTAQTKTSTQQNTTGQTRPKTSTRSTSSTARPNTGAYAMGAYARRTQSSTGTGSARKTGSNTARTGGNAGKTVGNTGKTGNSAVQKRPASKKPGKRKLRRLPKMPVALFGLLCVVVVLYMFIRIPLSKLGRTGGSKFGIEQNSGILVNNTDISTLSKGKLKQLLGNGKLNTDDKLVTIKSADGSYSIDYGFSDFDVVYDVDGTLQSASEFAKDTTSDNWWREYKALEGGNVNFDVIHYNKSKLNSSLKAIAKEIEVPSTDATAKIEDGKFVVTPSSIGYTIDSNTIFTSVDKLIKERNFGQDVVFQVSEVKPKFDESNFSEIDNIIGSCSSEYNNDDENRVQNLRNACEKINGVIVYPDEEFSTNEHFIPFTEKNGWREAGTIVAGKIEDSIGGGMCQVSSALYDALLEAEVQITQRSPHSMKVNYSEYGMDAALAGDYKDLCFKNDTGAPIYIDAYLTRSNVVINIYGKEIHDSGRRIEFESKLIDTVEPGDPIITYDSTLPEGTEQITTYALNGRTYELYKKIYENGELVDTVKVNTSTYSSRREEKTIGTKKADSSDS